MPNMVDLYTPRTLAEVVKTTRRSALSCVTVSLPTSRPSPPSGLTLTL